jgi:hypothetical protein
MRSLTLPLGLKDSILAKSRTPSAGLQSGNSMSGVRPMT